MTLYSLKNVMVITKDCLFFLEISVKLILMFVLCLVNKRDQDPQESHQRFCGHFREILRG
jgi:hypothetical protein